MLAFDLILILIAIVLSPLTKYMSKKRVRVSARFRPHSAQLSELMAAGGKAGSSSSSSKRGSTPLIRQEFVQHIIESEDQPVAGPSDLSSDQLSRAYGLSRQQQLVKQCTCRWSSDTREGDGDDGVLVLGSSDDDDDGPPSSPKKQSNKGKGKAKADTKVCSADNCTNNPKCLNWLGQDKWETSNPGQRPRREHVAQVNG